MKHRLVIEVDGGQHNFDQVLERIRLCEAQKSASAADIATFFAKQ